MLKTVEASWRDVVPGDTVVTSDGVDVVIGRFVWSNGQRHVELRRGGWALREGGGRVPLLRADSAPEAVRLLEKCFEVQRLEATVKPTQIRKLRRPRWGR